MRLQLLKFDWSKIFKTFLDMFLIFQIFDRFVKKCKKNLILMMHNISEND